MGGLAATEAAMGNWGVALDHARQAAVLDPRSAGAAARVALMLLYLRRYPEARGQTERALKLSPADPNLIADRAASFLGEGDLAGARAALHPTTGKASGVRGEDRTAGAGCASQILPSSYM